MQAAQASYGDWDDKAHATLDDIFPKKSGDPFTTRDQVAEVECRMHGRSKNADDVIVITMPCQGHPLGGPATQHS